MKVEINDDYHLESTCYADRTIVMLWRNIGTEGLGPIYISTAHYDSWSEAYHDMITRGLWSKANVLKALVAGESHG